jgi:F-type H+-transporting ATPase subunit a
MTDIEVFEQSFWDIGRWFGIPHEFLQINSTIILNTWLVMSLFFLFLFIAQPFLHNKKSIFRYLIFSGITSFIDLVTQTIGSFIYSHFVFIISLFVFLMLCNCIAIIPWTTEPTKDLNTALALGVISFLYKEVYIIKTHGFSGYIKEFLQPFFLMFPINVIGHFSKLISISFRLFGNIFGGAIIMDLYKGFISGSLILETLGIITGLNFLLLIFFGIFEGLIQAFVFTILSLTYLGLALQEEPSGEA